MVYISQAEHKWLNNEKSFFITENDKLNKEIDTLRKDMIVYCENEKLLKETIKHNKQTIEELQEENKKLKIKILHNVVFHFLLFAYTLIVFLCCDISLLNNPVLQ